MYIGKGLRTNGPRRIKPLTKQVEAGMQQGLVEVAGSHHLAAPQAAIEGSEGATRRAQEKIALWVKLGILVPWENVPKGLRVPSAHTMCKDGVRNWSYTRFLRESISDSIPVQDHSLFAGVVSLPVDSPANAHDQFTASYLRVLVDGCQLQKLEVTFVPHHYPCLKCRLSKMDPLAHETINFFWRGVDILEERYLQEGIHNSILPNFHASMPGSSHDWVYHFQRGMWERALRAGNISDES
jgi:hypothetical protein